MTQPYDYESQFTEGPQHTQRYVTYIPYGLTPETFEERKRVRKIANTIGAALLVVLALPEFVIRIIRFVLQIFNLWNQKTIDYFSDPAFNHIFNTLFSALLFTIPFVVACRVSKIRVSGLIRFRPPKKEDLLPYSLLGIASCAIANIAVSQMGNFFYLFGVNYDVNYGENPQGFFGFMLTFISTAIVPPLVEEFACRGIMLGTMRKFGNSFAIIGSAIIFGIMHGNFQQMPFAFLVGVVFGFVTVKTGSIWTAVAIHAFNNAFSVFYDYAFIGFSESAKSIGYYVFLIISMLLGILGVLLLSRREDAYSIKKKKTKAEKSKIYGWFFTSPTIIIFIVICVIKSFQYFV